MMQVAAPEPKPTEKNRAVRKPQSSGVVVPHHTRWHQRAIAWLVFGCIRGVSMTLRRTFTDRSGLFEPSPPPPAIYCVWHNRLALCMTVYSDYVKKRNQTPGLAAMVSASRDGGLLSAVLECFKVQPVRGSSSRRGRQALLELTTWAKQGYDLAITPDGPRGPRYEVNTGIISLAQLTGMPIVPVTYNLRWKIVSRSWDGFQIPLPFSKCEIVFGPPVSVPRGASEHEREARRKDLETALSSISKD
jgi:lysophospholipid acyltransferase (LPLAT)-like uncharacterized protein